MTRTRSEYRATEPTPTPLPVGITVVEAHTVDREVLATLLLDAYRDTIDDEGEDHDDALAAIDHYLDIILPDASVVLLDGDQPVAMSFALTVHDLHYIDPVITAAAHKGRGLGRAAASESIRRLGGGAIGATITDGNTPSERLFAGLAFTRVGEWPTA